MGRVGRPRSRGVARTLVAALVAGLTLTPGGLAAAEEPEAVSQAAVEHAAASPAPYDYPTPSEPTRSYPGGGWRCAAAVVDLLLVRPFMVAGLAGGAGLFVVTLPFTAATLTTDDAADALEEQAGSTFTRPLGAF